MVNFSLLSYLWKWEDNFADQKNKVGQFEPKHVLRYNLAYIYAKIVIEVSLKAY